MNESTPDERLSDDAELTLTRKILELETLYDFGMSVSTQLDVDQLCEEALTRLGALLDLNAGFLLLKQGDPPALRLVSCIGFERDEGTRFCQKEPLVMQVIQTGMGLIQNEFNHPLGARQFRRLMLTPLKANGELSGVLGVIDKEGSGEVPFTREDERLTAAFANQIGIAITNARLYTHLQDSNKRLGEALEELQATQKQIIQEERLRALGQMASGVVHDVNNAISAILGYTELWIMFPKMLDNRDKVLHDLDTINTAAKDATHIIRRLRGFYRSRDENNVVVSFSLNQVIDQAIDITRPKWSTQPSEQGITIRIEKEPGLIPQIEGDDADLREMFINLIFNAVDAMPVSGTITIRTRVEGKNVLLEVADTGTGMTDEVRRKCLEPFFSTKGDRGTGMGLAMVFGIVQRHRGTLDIESVPGVGTKFKICFPIPVSTPVADTRTQDQGLPHSLHTLVVEADPHQMEQIVHYLEEDGHKAVTAKSGVEALEKFHKEWFDVVITDAVMLEMDGSLLVKAIRKVAPRKPVIMVTALAFDESEEEEQEQEEDQLLAVTLQKPIIRELFRRALRQAIETVPPAGGSQEAASSE